MRKRKHTLSALSFALALVLAPAPIAELGTILQCGSADVPTEVCCKYVEAARKTADADARKILDRWLKKNCRKEGSP